MKLKKLKTSDPVTAYEITESEYDYKGLIWNMNGQGFNYHLYGGPEQVDVINPNFPSLSSAMENIELELQFGEVFEQEIIEDPQ